MALTELRGVGRVTVFPLEDLTVAYTTRSGDGRGLGEAARWILIQASRARVVAAFTDLRSVTWTAYVRRRFVLDALFANHEVLVTGRMELPGRFR
ncbi:hypothetical protein ABZX99_19735 [Streptomyces antibioticus]|uniref:hypothetical protein n=1 Tax=Streptomyces antibioticus TaxID=1890 RepID=UPI0033AA4AA5